MLIKIDYEEINIPGFEGLIVDKKNYSIRQSKKFIKKLLNYDYNYLKEGNFNKEIYYKIFTITCINKFNKYEFISTLNSRKLIKIKDFKMRYIKNGKQI